MLTCMPTSSPSLVRVGLHCVDLSEHKQPPEDFSKKLESVLAFTIDQAWCHVGFRKEGWVPPVLGMHVGHRGTGHRSH